MTAARKSLRGPGTNPKSSEEPLVPVISLPEKVPEWSTTGVDGNKVVTLPEGGHETVPAAVLCSLATCPQSGQVSTTDHINPVNAGLLFPKLLRELNFVGRRLFCFVGLIFDFCAGNYFLRLSAGV